MDLREVVFLAAIVSAYGGLALSSVIADEAKPTPLIRQSLKSPDDFAGIPDEQSRSIALFVEAGKVIQHPRCANCHPAGDRPHQGDDSHLHQPPITRGQDDFGAIGMRCTTCHGPSNFDSAHVPGNPKWHMAPLEMAWFGKSLPEICEQIKDPKRNGGRTLEAIIVHMSTDDLVGWAWAPGAGRTPAPGTQEEFGKLIKDWVATGAHCPAS